MVIEKNTVQTGAGSPFDYEKSVLAAVFCITALHYKVQSSFCAASLCLLQSIMMGILQPVQRMHQPAL